MPFKPSKCINLAVIYEFSQDCNYFKYTLIYFVLSTILGSYIVIINEKQEAKLNGF